MLCRKWESYFGRKERNPLNGFPSNLGFFRNRENFNNGVHKLESSHEFVSLKTENTDANVTLQADKFEPDFLQLVQTVLGPDISKSELTLKGRGMRGRRYCHERDPECI